MPMLGRSTARQGIAQQCTRGIVVSPEPFCGLLLCLLNGFKYVLPQPFSANRAIVALDIGTLLRLSGLDIFKPDAPFLSPRHPLPGRALHSNVPKGSFPLTYSGPLSTRMILGLPRHSMIWSKLRTTRSAGSEKSTSMPKPSRLKSSSTFNVLIDRPSANWSAIKSPNGVCCANACRAVNDQVSFGMSGTASGSGLSLFRRFLGLIRRFNSNSQ